MIRTDISKRLFGVGIFSTFALSLVLRFWGLSRFNTLIFDEVHFVKFANNYLIQQPFFENHPPLGKYFIAIGIWLSELLSFGRGESNNLAGSPLTPFSYRWMNAFMGSLIPLVISGITYQLSARRSYALIAGFLAALDGLFLVESRYALINIYLVLFGLLGQWLFLSALERSADRRRKYLTLAGACFGASFSVKWSGLGFLLAVYLLWIIAKVIATPSIRKILLPNAKIASDSKDLLAADPLHSLAQFKLIDLLTELGIIPLIVYCLAWIPHLQLNANMGFWGWQKYLYSSQKSIGANVHPYCSAWYTWILMIRPVGYYFQIIKRPPENSPDLSPLLQKPAPVETYYDVHAIGNPALWWLATIAIFILGGLLIRKLVFLYSNLAFNQNKALLLASSSFWIPLYLVTNYTANLLPWIAVTRCTFLYHYMGASVFSLMAIAWVVDLGLRQRHFALRIGGAMVIVLIIISFLYWLPIYLGLPLTSTGFHSRMWLPSWY